MIFEKEKLLVVLNELYFRKKRVLKVKYSGIGEIFRIELEKPRIYAVKLEEYERGLSETKIPSSVFNEIPSYNDYLYVLRASGVLKPRNWEEIRKGFMKGIERNPLKGHRVLFIGFDTSVLVERFPSIILKGIDREKFGVCLNRGVLEELYSKWDKKIGSGLNVQLRRISKEFNFINQPTLCARKFKIGAIEYRKLKRSFYFEEIEGEKGDKNIIDKYREFLKKKNIDLMIFSGDNNFVERVNEIGCGMQGIRVDRNYEIPRVFTSDWEEIVELLYCAAIIYGFVSFSGVSLHGIWAGKKEEHWNSECVRVSFENAEMKEEIERELSILKCI